MEIVYGESLMGPALFWSQIRSTNQVQTSNYYLTLLQVRIEAIMQEKVQYKKYNIKSTI